MEIVSAVIKPPWRKAVQGQLEIPPPPSPIPVPPQSWCGLNASGWLITENYSHISWNYRTASFGFVVYLSPWLPGSYWYTGNSGRRLVLYHLEVMWYQIQIHTIDTLLFWKEGEYNPVFPVALTYPTLANNGNVVVCWTWSCVDKPQVSSATVSASQGWLAPHRLGGPSSSNEPGYISEVIHHNVQVHWCPAMSLSLFRSLARWLSHSLAIFLSSQSKQELSQKDCGGSFTGPRTAFTAPIKRPWIALGLKCRGERNVFKEVPVNLQM